MAMASDFYLRYYVGHKGKFGHEFLEFEFRPDGEQGSGGAQRSAQRREAERRGRGGLSHHQWACKSAVAAEVTARGEINTN